MLPVRLFRLTTIAMLILMTATLVISTPRQVSADDALTDSQRTEVEKLIQTYLRDNPEILVEAIRALREKQEQAQLEESQAAVMDFKMRLSHGLDAPALGPTNASVTIVEFFDYRCGYCKKVFPDMKALMDGDQDIRFVFMEFPILGDESVLASQAALAVWLNSPTKYIDMHNALMSSRGGLNESKVMEIAARIGLDVGALRATMASEEVDQLIRANYELAQSMNINGTPAFIIGDELVPGAIDMATMKHLIEAARNS